MTAVGWIDCKDTREDEGRSDGQKTRWSVVQARNEGSWVQDGRGPDRKKGSWQRLKVGTTEGQCGHKEISWGFWTPQRTFTTICFWKVCVLSSSVASNSFMTPWPEAHQAPLSMGSPRQAYWSGLLFPPPGDLPDPGIEPQCPLSPALQVDSLPTEPTGKPFWKVWWMDKSVCAFFFFNKQLHYIGFRP